MCSFRIFHTGHELNVVHNEPIDGIKKIAAHNDHVFVLSTLKQLFFGTLNGSRIQLELIRADVIDVACSVDSIYVIDENGGVQHCPLMAFAFDKRWNDIPILNYGAIYEGVSTHSSDHVRVVEVSCNNDGALFITADRELYAMGNFNDVCKSDQPTKVSQFIHHEILQVSMGRHFAVILTRKRSSQTLHATSLHASHIDSSSCDESIHSLDTSLANTSIAENDCISMRSATLHDTYGSESLNSSTLNLRTVTNNTDTESSTPEHSLFCDVEHVIERLMRTHDGIQTQVWSFGSINKSGQLGVGDHVKRSNVVEVVSLRDQGVMRICCGDEHTAALTLDARLYLWGDNSNEQISHWLDKQDCSSPKRFTKNEQSIFGVQCGQQSTFVITNTFDRFELSRNVHFPGICIIHEDDEKAIANNPKDFLFLSSKQYLVVGESWTSLRFEKYLKFEQQFLQDALQNTRHNVERFLRTMNRNINIKHQQLYRQFGQQYVSITKLFAKNVASMRDYACRRSDFTAIAFIRCHVEYVHVFRQYARLYCETICADDLPRVSESIITNADFGSRFSTPIHHTSNYLDFIEELLKSNAGNELLRIALNDWKQFSTEADCMIKLGHSTIQFWSNNQKNIPPTLQQPERRFILDSRSEFALKLLPSSRFKSNWFILFNDILCHSTGSSSSFRQYPLKTVWINNIFDKDVSPSSSSTSTLNAKKYSFKIITPEEQFLISATSNEAKVRWLESFDKQIRNALGKSNSKSSLLRRTTSFTFSDKHRVYPSCRYLGQWYCGKIDGIGCIEYPDGRVYTGQLKANAIHGYGRLMMTNGSYEGRFVDGHFEGHGTLETNQASESYERYFKNGLKHGFGIQQEFDTNRTYMGEFANGVPSGYGVDDSESGKYMGTFLDGHRYGHGICITADGTYFEGNFIENDVLNGSSVAYFANGSFFIGDLSIRGPNGRGMFHLPLEPVQNEVNVDMDSPTSMIRGNILTGLLGGSWENVRINSGSMQINQEFEKYPSQFDHRQIDCQYKWASLFSDWEQDVFGGPITDITDIKKLWNKITEYIDIVKHLEVLKSTISTSAIVYKSEIQANKLQQQSQASHFPYEFLSSNSHEYHVSKSLSLSRITGKNYKRNLLAVERAKSISNEFLNSAVNFSAEDTSATKMEQNETRENDCDDRLALSAAMNSSVPCFGTTKLDANDLRLVRDYLTKAFKNQYHPLGILNTKVSYCFYTSYGCWKVKPVSILSTHAMKEWESISKRIYDILRRMFPTLPQEYGTLDDEFISHRSLLYPILLSEGVYSTLFVLYANKCSKRDEIYRQRIQMSERKTDPELATFLKLSSKYLRLMKSEEFSLAIVTLRQVKEKFCPREMLNLIEMTFKHVENAAEIVSELGEPTSEGAMGTECSTGSDTTKPEAEVVQLNADNMMPLTIFLLLRAAIPHLGTEILLLEDLMGPDFEFVMNGFAGYCFTTIKAAYQHIINDSFLQ